MKATESNKQNTNYPGVNPGGKELLNMTQNLTKNIEVKVLDASATEEIKKALIDIKADDEGNKVINLNLISTTGQIPSAIELVGMTNTEFITNCNGEIGLAGVILAAGSKFGERKSTSMSMFRLVEDDKNVGKKRTSLTPNEKNALEVLGVLSGGKKSRIKAFMLKGLKATANEAKSLGLIDEVECFKDKYSIEREKAKKSTKEVG